MARRKLSEYRAKRLLGAALSEPYDGLSIDTAAKDWNKRLEQLPREQHFVVKVDQAVKRRFHLGLLRLDREANEVVGDVQALAAKGFRYFLVEPLQAHEASAERYLALERRREGVRISYAAEGGVDVEHNPAAVQSGLAHEATDMAEAAKALEVSIKWLQHLLEAFESHYMSFLEINPLVVDAQGVAILDAAAEVDDAAALLVDGAWSSADYRRFSTRPPTPSERTVESLAERSQASLSLEVLNPDGAVFLLLSGGGASVVVADEVADRGAGKLLANYGEYSGNPTADETETYATAVLDLLLASAAPAKVLVIAGGVANFTDVRATFRGITRALQKHERELQQQSVKVYVRRGGPHQTEALAAMRAYLEKSGLLGAVAGPELVLTEIVRQALAGADRG